MNNIPKGYKQTKVGVIPEEWEVVRLGDILKEKPKYGINAPAVKYSKKLPRYLRITDFDDGKIDSKKKVSVKNENYKNYILQANDLVFARTGATVGKSYLYEKKDGELVYAGFLIKITPNNSKLNSIFLKNYLATNKYWNWVKNMSRRSGQPGINGKEYALLPIPLPPLKEQQKIAEILTTWDSAISKQEELIKEKEKLKKGLMQKLLSGEVRFKEFSDEWEEVRLGDLLVYEQPTKYLVDNTDYDKNYNIPVLTAGKTFILGYTNEKDGVFNNELPVIIFDDFTTATKFVDFPFKVKSSAIKILKRKNENVNIKFIFEMMQMINFEAYDHKRYWISEYQEIELKLPSLQEQQKIADVLSTADREIELLKKELEELKKQKKGLMQRLLSGEVRVKV